MSKKDYHFAGSLKICEWKDVNKELVTVNPQLSKLIDNLNPPSHFKLLRVPYPFGATVMDSQQLYAVDAHFNEVLLNDLLPKTLADQAVPLMISLNKASEISLETCERRMPFHLIAQGEVLYSPDFFNQNETLGFNLPWKISSGARSIFMLPKVTDTNGHRRLYTQFRVQMQPPQSLWQHHKIFSQIAKASSGEGDDWCSEMIIFTRPWFDEKNNSVDWQIFKNYLLQSNHPMRAYYRQQTIFKLFWSMLMPRLASRYTKLRPYLVDTVNHLLSIASGTIPGFQAAGSSEMMAPIKRLERAYTEVYGLKEYLPIIMQPTYINANDKKMPCYYSLTLPTVLESYLGPRTIPNVIHELRDLKYTFELFKESLQKENLLTTDSCFSALDYSYFHLHALDQSNIRVTGSMPKADHFLTATAGEYKDRVFPAASPFIRGCVRMSATDKAADNVIQLAAGQEKRLTEKAYS